MSKAEKYLPFILVALGPAVGAINNQSLKIFEDGWWVFSMRYFQIASFLLMAWYVNKYLVNADYQLKQRLGLVAATVLVNAIFIGIFISLDYFSIPEGLTSVVNLPVVSIRLTLVILVFNVILRVFKAQRERSDLQLQNLSLQAENLKFQVKTLKQQINPHFLFNSLNTLIDLIEEDPTAAVKFARNFSNLYRIVLQSAKHDFIPLKDELDFLQEYMNLLKVRFKEAIALKIDIDESKMEHLIPPLSLQFLVENAVKHNELTRKVPLLIEILGKNGTLQVRNPLNPKSFPVQSEKVGLKNLQQRFSMLYKPLAYGIEGNDYVVSLPLKNA